MDAAIDSRTLRGTEATALPGMYCPALRMKLPVRVDIRLAREGVTRLVALDGSRRRTAAFARVRHIFQSTLRTGGSGHAPRARSYAPATESSSPSSYAPAASCRPIGRPLWDSPHGTLIAGRRLRLYG